MTSNEVQCFSEVVEQIITEHASIEASMERIPKAIFKEKWNIRRLYSENEYDAMTTIALALAAIISQQNFVILASKKLRLDKNSIKTKFALLDRLEWGLDLDHAIEVLQRLANKCEDIALRDMILSWLYFIKSIKAKHLKDYQQVLDAAKRADALRKNEEALHNEEEAKRQLMTRLQEERKQQEEQDRNKVIGGPGSKSKP